ncbi:hypothetical protein ACFP47_09215 [Nesterenkonia lacusekhoensis]|uniref:Uncharacterized protein n=1 Tax=Nesterenkonia lacusekhoensis TaxID=150832 RepID=A0ABS4SYX2_9MICC|nr:hypothetical protein [Nesterenkonia lacusekhoensis]MBP2317404.1 hypothetical protein [Nesterenkonia lacusekhoensis]
MLETAEKYGRPPSTWLGGLDGEWGEKDQVLTLVYTLYKDGLCSCGQPIILAHDDENSGWFVAQESVCVACAAVEDHREDKGDDVEKGAKVFPVSELDQKPSGS